MIGSSVSRFGPRFNWNRFVGGSAARFKFINSASGFVNERDNIDNINESHFPFWTWKLTDNLKIVFENYLHGEMVKKGLKTRSRWLWKFIAIFKTGSILKCHNALVFDFI